MSERNTSPEREAQIRAELLTAEAEVRHEPVIDWFEWATGDLLAMLDEARSSLEKVRREASEERQARKEISEAWEIDRKEDRDLFDALVEALKPGEVMSSDELLEAVRGLRALVERATSAAEAWEKRAQEALEVARKVRREALLEAAIADVLRFCCSATSGVDAEESHVFNALLTDTQARASAAEAKLDLLRRECASAHEEAEENRERAEAAEAERDEARVSATEWRERAEAADKGYGQSFEEERDALRVEREQMLRELLDLDLVLPFGCGSRVAAAKRLLARAEAAEAMAEIRDGDCSHGVHGPWCREWRSMEARAEAAESDAKKVRVMLDEVTGRAFGDDAYIIGLEKRADAAEAALAALRVRVSEVVADMRTPMYVVTASVVLAALDAALAAPAPAAEAYRAQVRAAALREAADRIGVGLPACASLLRAMADEEEKR